MKNEITVPEGTEELTERVRLCPDGKYRWVYEFPMLRNPAILISVLKVLGLSAAIVAVFGLVVDLLSGGKLTPPDAGEGKILLLVLLVFIAVVLVSYVILAAMYGWKYIVLFEMDEKGIDHIQLPKQFEKAQALMWLAAMAGIEGGNLTAAGSAVLASSRISSYSAFDEVRGVIGRKGMDLIRLRERFERNQIYVHDEDYPFVWDYLCRHCPNARIR